MRIAVIAVVAATATSLARADDAAGQCRGYGDLKDYPDLAVSRIVSTTGRVPFIRSFDGANGCPNATDGCREPAYLVPGDRVIAGAILRGFTCVDYVYADLGERTGWVPSANVVRQPAPIGNAEWIGTWEQSEAKITIRPARGRRLDLKGSATYGMFDPERVRRGAINTGEFEADAAVSGSDLSFDVAEGGTLPVEKGDDIDCKIWMKLLGPYLLVDDNNACGGWNVTFRGLYRRIP